MYEQFYRKYWPRIENYIYLTEICSNLLNIELKNDIIWDQRLWEQYCSIRSCRFPVNTKFNFLFIIETVRSKKINLLFTRVLNASWMFLFILFKRLIKFSACPFERLDKVKLSSTYLQYYFMYVPYILLLIILLVLISTYDNFRYMNISTIYLYKSHACLMSAATLG